MTTCSPNQIRQLSIQLALGSRILGEGGHEDFNQGQISGRLPDRKHFLIKDTNTAFGAVDPDSMVCLPCEGTYECSAKVPPETPLHRAIYAARPDVGAIVHSHSPYALLFGATTLTIQAISHEGAYFHDNVGRFDETTHTILNEHTADQVARALGGRSALLLQNHGSVVVGKSVRQVTVLALMLERAAMLQLEAVKIGLPFKTSPIPEIPMKREYIYSDLALKSYWEASVSATQRTNPEIQKWSMSK
jgi:L-fuculose-phosphate aldolase